MRGPGKWWEGVRGRLSHVTHSSCPGAAAAAARTARWPAGGAVPRLAAPPGPPAAAPPAAARRDESGSSAGGTPGAGERSEGHQVGEGVTMSMMMMMVKMFSYLPDLLQLVQDLLLRTQCHSLDWRTNIHTITTSLTSSLSPSFHLCLSPYHHNSACSQAMEKLHW